VSDVGGFAAAAAPPTESDYERVACVRIM